MQRELTDLEGMLLASIWREQPCSFYWIKKLMDQSPTGGNRDRAGSIYPAINRLVKYELVTKTRVKTDGRGTNILECTDKGIEKIREWVLDIKPPMCFPIDPIRTKSFFLGALTKEEQKLWLEKAKQACVEQMETIQQFESLTEEKADDYSDIGHSLARAVVKARLTALKKVR